FDFPAAIESLVEYLRVAGSGVPAERRRQIEEFLAEMQAALVVVTVSVSEEGAAVVVDGTEVGRSPLAAPLRLRSGLHVIEGRLDGFDDARQPIEAAAGERVDVVLTLVRRSEAAPAVLRVWADAPGASVWIDGTPRGTAPLDVEVPPGPHEVRVEADGHASWAGTAEAVNGRTVEVAAVLVPLGTPPGPEGPIEPEDESIFEAWWLWTIVGAVVVGGAATATVLLWPEEARAEANWTLWVR
ncbi:MAG: PEGA domain-containing protein, partial [Myxococcota bacterium]|nr:PEGA domain-containing protein [Myxococcota bacterium]